MKFPYTQVLFSALAVLAGAAACDNEARRSETRAASERSSRPSAAASASPEADLPPVLSIDSIGVKLGFTRILLEHPDGKQQLVAEFATNRRHFSGKTVNAIVDRNAKLATVTRVLDELGKLSASGVLIHTGTRKEFPNELEFRPLSIARNAPRCSVVAMVLEDRGTAVWRLTGGVAAKRARGFAGPDLSMTGDTLERLAKSCKESKTLFVAAIASIEWGLAYDLAASAKSLPASPFQEFAVVAETPTPGHPVEL